MRKSTVRYAMRDTYERQNRDTWKDPFMYNGKRMGMDFERPCMHATNVHAYKRANTNHELDVVAQVVALVRDNHVEAGRSPQRQSLCGVGRSRRSGRWSSTSNQQKTVFGATFNVFYFYFWSGMRQSHVKTRLKISYQAVLRGAVPLIPWFKKSYFLTSQ